MAGGIGSIPDQGSKISHVAWLGQKNPKPVIPCFYKTDSYLTGDVIYHFVSLFLFLVLSEYTCPWATDRWSNKPGLEEL